MQPSAELVSGPEPGTSTSATQTSPASRRTTRALTGPLTVVGLCSRELESAYLSDEGRRHALPTISSMTLSLQSLEET